MARPKKQEKRCNVSLFLDEGRKRLLEELAKRHFRTVSDELRFLLERELEANGMKEAENEEGRDCLLSRHD